MTVRALPVELTESQRREAERISSRRFWAATMLALDLDTCESIMRGRPVMAGRLDGEALRRALRGAALPPWDSYIDVTAEMLDAVAEAGPLAPTPWEKR